MKNRILLFLLSLLGFAGCSDPDNDRGAMPEYGSPPATFTIKGRVTDTAGVPIEGIRIISAQARYKGEEDKPVEDVDLGWADTTYTSKTGGYMVQNFYIHPVKYDAILRVDDVDGMLNGGKFASQQVDIDINDDAPDYTRAEDIRLEPENKQ